SELPNPSYVLRSSPGRAHVFWRVRRFTCDTVEALEKHLARKLGTDAAATACTQLTRLPGFVNHKRATPSLVAIDYRDVDRVYEQCDFPMPPPPTMPAPTPVKGIGTNAVDRARHYVAAIPPAVSGQHGDVHTFRVCCRVVRGFALADDEALDVLRDWNSRCEPPWSDRELIDKLSRARRYGREPIGCLLEERP
ncbi:MAG: DNA-primase RepB domain-containing protein, partial [Gemmatimonadaceae bacterium]